MIPLADPRDLMDSGTSGRYNLHFPQRSAGAGDSGGSSRVAEKYYHSHNLHATQKQGHATSSSFGFETNGIKTKLYSTFPGLPEIKENNNELHQRIEINQSGDSSDIVKISKERASETLGYGRVKQDHQTYLISPPEEIRCLVCFPHTETTYTMGNKTSSSKICTCKVEDQRQGHRKSRQISKKGRKSKSKENPLQDESLSDVFQNLKIGSNDIQDTEVPRHVLYYAWFFNPEVSLLLKTIAHNFLTECLLVNQFERFIQSLLSAHKIQDPLQLYKKPGKRKPDDKLEYHVTAKFCDRQQCSPYQENVQHFVGNTFKLHIVGLFITEKTFGFRVKLTTAQKALFDERKISDTCARQSVKESISHKYDFRWDEVAKLNALEMTEDWGKDPKCKSDIHKSYAGITLVRQKEDFHPTDSRAHITIGCAPFVKAFQTGEDLVDILDLEMRPTMFHQDFQIQGATLRQFGRSATAFVVYPHHEVLAEATFNMFI